MRTAFVGLAATSLLVLTGQAAEPFAAPGVTSLTARDVRYRVPDKHYAILSRGPVTAVIVDNEAVDVPECPGHRAGYNGVAVLRHAKRGANLFVPSYAGLNFEHIHDGTTIIDRTGRFEPRMAPMELRVIDEHTVELHQAPTPHFRLESCGRYRLLEDGAIEYTFECIPRAETFSQGYIGLFWASYIHAPESTAIRFRGRKAGSDQKPEWIESISPRHGTDSTHPPADARFIPPVAADFSLTLVSGRSKWEHTEAWYYGISHGIALAQMFRPRDAIWFAQSPTGGGDANPAWDFQWFIPECRVGEAYGFVMRAAAVPFESAERLEEGLRPHRRALEKRHTQ